MAGARALFVAVLVTLLALANAHGLSHTCTHGKRAYNLAHNNELLELTSRVSNPSHAELRIKIDTTYALFGSDRGYTCYSAGDTYLIGEAPQGGMAIKCAGDVLTNCYAQCLPEDVVDQTEVNAIINNIVEEARDYISKLLKVESLPRLSIKTKECGLMADGGVRVPDAYINGIDSADLVFFLTLRPVSGGTMAWALPCERIGSKGRPIAGLINVDPEYVTVDSFGNIIARATLVRVIIHEMFHAMGFSLPFFEEAGIVQDVEETASTKATYKVKGIAGPKTLGLARGYFACQNMKAVPLEDGAIEGTSNHHFEMRIFGNEVMVGRVSKGNYRDPVVSPMSLAVFEDLGFYTPHYEAAEYFDYGRGRGCPFVHDDCTTDMWVNHRYTCNLEDYKAGSAVNRCTYDRRAKGTCMWYNEVPAHYSHFTSLTGLGGPHELADYCPLITATDASSCNPTVENLDPDLKRGETHCPDCRCFEADLLSNKEDWATHQEMAQNPAIRCLNKKCAKNGQGLQTLYVSADSAGGQWVECPWAGTASITGFHGVVHCPPRTDEPTLCPMEQPCPNNCNKDKGLGECKDGACTCVAGRTGVDCSSYSCPNGCSDHGVCNSVDGLCACDAGFGGTDCSRPGSGSPSQDLEAQSTQFNPAIDNQATSNPTKGTTEEVGTSGNSGTPDNFGAGNSGTSGNSGTPGNLGAGNFGTSGNSGTSGNFGSSGFHPLTSDNNYNMHNYDLNSAGQGGSYSTTQHASASTGGSCGCHSHPTGSSHFPRFAQVSWGCECDRNGQPRYFRMQQQQQVPAQRVPHFRSQLAEISNSLDRRVQERGTPYVKTSVNSWRSPSFARPQPRSQQVQVTTTVERPWAATPSYGTGYSSQFHFTPSQFQVNVMLEKFSRLKHKVDESIAREEQLLSQRQQREQQQQQQQQQPGESQTLLELEEQDSADAAKRYQKIGSMLGHLNRLAHIVERML